MKTIRDYTYPNGETINVGDIVYHYTRNVQAVVCSDKTDDDGGVRIFVNYNGNEVGWWLNKLILKKSAVVNKYHGKERELKESTKDIVNCHEQTLILEMVKHGLKCNCCHKTFASSDLKIGHNKQEKQCTKCWEVNQKIPQNSNNY